MKRHISMILLVAMLPFAAFGQIRPPKNEQLVELEFETTAVPTSLTPMPINQTFWLDTVIFINTTTSPIDVAYTNLAGSILGGGTVPAAGSTGKAGVLLLKVWKQRCTNGIQVVASATGVNVSIFGRIRE